MKLSEMENSPERSSRIGCGIMRLLWTLAALICLALFGANLFLGDLNQDEGWYLYGAKLVHEGRLPYVDFASTQSPVLPFVYSIAQPLVDCCGVAGGRLFTGILGLFCIALASYLAARVSPPGTGRIAAFVAFCLAGINVYQSYFFVIVKTYSLAGLFITAGFLCLAAAEKRRAWFMLLLAGIFMALAAGTRISAGCVLPVVLLGLIWCAARKIGGWPKTAWLWFTAGAALASACIFVPFAMKAPQALFFALYEYHAGREPGSLITMLAYKAGFISRVVQVYFVGVSLLAGLCIHMALSRRNAGAVMAQAAGERPQPMVVIMWAGMAAVTLAHIMAGFPYDDYQAMIYPVFAACVSALLMKALAKGEQPSFTARGAVTLLVTALVVTSAASLSSPLNEKWFVRERDRIWWPIRTETPLQNLRRAAAEIRRLVPAGGELLTQDPYLAVEAGLSVPHGLELGPFSYFPGWSREKAEKCHVVNKEMMLDLLGKCEAPAAAFSGYGLAIKAPAITPLTAEEHNELWSVVERRYERYSRVDGFGQIGTPLDVLVRKKDVK